MPPLTKLLSWIFAAISLGVVGFFTHKVLWLVRYKKLQRKLMDRAAGELRAAQDAVLPEWDALTVGAWRAAEGLAAKHVENPKGFTVHVEQELATTLRDLPQRAKIAPLLEQTVDRNDRGPVTVHVLSAPLRDGSNAVAVIRLDPPLVSPATPPQTGAFELNVKSRYSFWRRALVFVTGLADVVYSSQHIAKMSQYAHVSTGTILRRMSLVILLVVGILLEVVVGLRAALERFLDRRVLRGASWVRDLPDVIGDNIAFLLALLIWTGLVAGLYFGLYFRIRRRSKQNLEALRELQAAQTERLRAIRERHLASLRQWARAYGKSLDSAVELTARHIEMLGNHYAARVRRHLGGTVLLDMAKLISDRLFALLPEAKGDLQSAVDTQERSFGHAFWPRAEEMTDAIEQAQYREAWQQLELNLGELQRGEPDPDHVTAMWRTLVLFTVRFQAHLPSDMMARLRAAYVELVEATAAATDVDLESYQTSVRELIRHLDEQLDSATPLLTARVELANQRIRADSADFAAEVIRTREAARLEAMAFEI